MFGSYFGTISCHRIQGDDLEIPRICFCWWFCEINLTCVLARRYWLGFFGFGGTSVLEISANYTQAIWSISATPREWLWSRMFAWFPEGEGLRNYSQTQKWLLVAVPSPPKLISKMIEITFRGPNSPEGKMYDDVIVVGIMGTPWPHP